MSDFVDSLRKLKDMDSSDLDLENVGSWPVAVKVILCIATFALMLWLGYQFHLSAMQNNLYREQKVEVDLKEQFRVKAFQAANLDAYRQQMIEMETSFGALIRQLPSDTEVPGLLEDITYTGVGAGLRFEEIQLQKEVSKEFYVELPIKISVKGNYHDLGSFVSGVSGLPRIVTLHDFSIKPEGNSLSMNILARTYRYNDKGGQ